MPGLRYYFWSRKHVDPLAGPPASKIAKRFRKRVLKAAESSATSSQPWSPLFPPTYDKSAQIVHPDIIQWKGRYWLAVTPYPFGLDTYENPCLFVSDDTRSWEEVSPEFNPVFIPEGRPSTHLSDPWFFIEEDKLVLGFRWTHKKSPRSENRLYRTSSTDGKQWSPIVEIVHSTECSFLSPAVINYKGGLHLLWADLTDSGSVLRSSILPEEGSALESETIVKIASMPEGMMLWHLSAMSSSLQSSSSQQYEGLFLLRSEERNSNNHFDYQLVKVVAENPLDHWDIVGTLSIPLTLEELALYPYKASLYTDIDGDSAVVASFCSKKGEFFSASFKAHFV